MLPDDVIITPRMHIRVTVPLNTNRRAAKVYPAKVLRVEPGKRRQEDRYRVRHLHADPHDKAAERWITREQVVGILPQPEATST